VQLKHTTITCPHCGHHLHIELDYSDGDQDYYEDCANCCNPIHLNMHIDELAKKLDVNVSADDEQFY
jgi:transcription elongation factor Elf1